jgi:hypothetical protein
MNKDDVFVIRGPRIKGSFGYFKLAIQILLFPSQTYRLLTSDKRYVDVSAKTIADVIEILSISFWHLIYGATLVVDNKFIKPSEWDSVITKY